MLVQQFMRMPEFGDVPASELRALAATAHVLCLPANRWLLQAGRDIDAYFYLLKGSIELRQPRRRLRARSIGRLAYFYPGCSSARTLKSVQILRVDAQQREFLLQTGRGNMMAAAVGAEKWLERFLSSNMMCQLPSNDWQQLLGAFCVQYYGSGKAVLRRGTRGEHCFVIEAGHAVVHDGAKTLCHLGPGDFFGEDALILGSRRNADVSALEDMRVHAIHKRVFLAVLLENLVQFVAHRTQGVLLRLGEASAAAAPTTIDIAVASIRQQAMQLDARISYYVSGGSRSERALCAFLLIQKGLRAYPLEG